MDIDAKVNAAPWYWRPAYEDPQNSADVFARGVFNAWGKPYCLAAAITPEEAERMVLAHNKGLVKV